MKEYNALACFLTALSLNLFFFLESLLKGSCLVPCAKQMMRWLALALKLPLPVVWSLHGPPSSSQHFCKLPRGVKGTSPFAGWRAGVEPQAPIQSLSSSNLRSHYIDVGCGAVPNARFSCRPAASPRQCLGKWPIASSVPDSQHLADVPTNQTHSK